MCDNSVGLTVWLSADTDHTLLLLPAAEARPGAGLAAPAGWRATQMAEPTSRPGTEGSWDRALVLKPELSQGNWGRWSPWGDWIRTRTAIQPLSKGAVHTGTLDVMGATQGPRRHPRPGRPAAPGVFGILTGSLAPVQAAPNISSEFQKSTENARGNSLKGWYSIIVPS